MDIFIKVVVSIAGYSRTAAVDKYGKWSVKLDRVCRLTCIS